MLQESFSRVYLKFKLHFYEKVFQGFENREATLTTVETASTGWGRRGISEGSGPRRTGGSTTWR